MERPFASEEESRELSNLSDEIERLELLLAKELGTAYAKRLKKGTCSLRAWEMWMDKYFRKIFNRRLGEGDCTTAFINTWTYAYRYIHPVCTDKNCYCCNDPNDIDGIYAHGNLMIQAENQEI